MTITPLSLSSGTSTAPGANAATTDAAASTGFADLLSLQLADLNGLIQLVAKPEEPREPVGGKTEEVASSDDPAQLLAGLMAATPPASPRPDPASGKQTGKTDALLAIDKSTEKAQAALLPGANLPAEKALEDVLKKVPATAADTVAARVAKEDSAAAKIAAAPAAEVPAGGFAQALATHISEPRHVAAHQNNAAPIVGTPLGDSRWSQDFGEKLVWMANSDRQSAQININPPQLGPVQITLDIKGGEATAYFASPHGEVRQAIESALPHLREMLAGAGIDLGQANVGAQFARQDAQNQSQQSDSSRFSDDNAILHGDSSLGAATPVAVQRGRGMVDLFA
ncbi:MAG: flagellar hook-length control protein FliK [Betaproteobacteria bacterium]